MCAACSCARPFSPARLPASGWRDAHEKVSCAIGQGYGEEGQGIAPRNVLGPTYHNNIYFMQEPPVCMQTIDANPRPEHSEVTFIADKSLAAMKEAGPDALTPSPLLVTRAGARADSTTPLWRNRHDRSTPAHFCRPRRAL